MFTFKWKLFFVLLIVVSFLTWFSYTLAMGRTSPEGQNPGSSWELFQIFRFPTHTLFEKFFYSSSTVYRLGLVINICFYSFLLERTIALMKIIFTSQSDDAKNKI